MHSAWRFMALGTQTAPVSQGLISTTFAAGDESYHCVFPTYLHTVKLHEACCLCCIKSLRNQEIPETRYLDIPSPVHGVLIRIAGDVSTAAIVKLFILSVAKII